MPLGEQVSSSAGEASTMQQKAPAIEQHPGRPLEPQQRDNIHQGKPAGPMIWTKKFRNIPLRRWSATHRLRTAPLHRTKETLRSPRDESDSAGAAYAKHDSSGFTTSCGHRESVGRSTSRWLPRIVRRQPLGAGTQRLFQSRTWQRPVRSGRGSGGPILSRFRCSLPILVHFMQLAASDTSKP